MRPLRIGILKPDYSIVGGFERVVSRVEAMLRGAGHVVERITVDLQPPARTGYGRTIPADVWYSAHEYFRYLYGRDRFEHLDTRALDLVISTQPPSFSHTHPRHLALFYHHQRVFYDLEDLYIEAGFVDDEQIHRHAAAHMRELDAPHLDAVTHFLTPSDTVADRLIRFNDRHDSGRFLAGIGVGDDDAAVGPPGREGRVLCVGRHEFPKRVELLVAAAHLVPDDVEVTCIGGGSRLARTRLLDHRIGRGELDAATVDARTLWCNTGEVDDPDEIPEPDRDTGRMRFRGRVSDDELLTAYRDATCVVAPALDEDYGLTAIEAMAHGRPVIVCADGGGLAELVDHEVTGLVVAPDPVSIAEAISRLHGDPSLAAHLGANGRERARELTWKAAGDQLLEGVEATMDAPLRIAQPARARR